MASITVTDILILTKMQKQQISQNVSLIWGSCQFWVENKAKKIGGLNENINFLVKYKGGQIPQLGFVLLQ